MHRFGISEALDVGLEVRFILTIGAEIFQGAFDVVAQLVARLFQKFGYGLIDDLVLGSVQMVADSVESGL